MDALAPQPRRSRLAALLAGLACALVLGALPAAAAAAPVSAGSASSFVESIGVDTHTYYLDTAYKNFDLVKQRLEELGVHHIRENLVTGHPEQYEDLNQLAAAGIRSTLIMGSPENGSTGLNELVSIVGNQLQGSVDAVEGPNEYDLSGDPSWMGKLATYQEQLYAAVKSNPATSALPVLGPSLGNTESVASDISGSMDYGNIHSYPNAEPPENNLTRMFSFASEMSGSKPLVATETGYHTALNYQGGHQPASEAAEATYIPRLFLEYYRRGIARTFVYELVDEFPDPSHSEAEKDFGLLHNDFSPKPAFTALSNLTSILSDSGPAFTPGQLDYSVSGDESNLHQVLLQKSDGSYYLALWRDESVWNNRSHTPETAASGNVQVSFPAPAEEVQEYQPNRSNQPLRTVASSASSVSVNVGPQVVILRIGGSGPVGRIKAWVSKRAVQSGGQVAVKGKVPQAGSAPVTVAIQRWQGRWHTVARSRANANGFFHKNLRLVSHHPGPSRFRVVCSRAKPSNQVRVRVLSGGDEPQVAVANHLRL